MEMLLNSILIIQNLLTTVCLLNVLSPVIESALLKNTVDSTVDMAHDLIFGHNRCFFA